MNENEEWKCGKLAALATPGGDRRTAHVSPVRQIVVPGVACLPLAEDPGYLDARGAVEAIHIG
jgi:hypothetical protein